MYSSHLRNIWGNPKPQKIRIGDEKNMKKRIPDEEEVKLYHIVCDISKICKDYFYERKYLPNDYWKVDDVVKQINDSAKELKQLYNQIRKNMVQ